MVKGKTTTGFEFCVDGEHLKNAEFLEMVADMNKGEGLVFFDILKTVLGEDQKKALFDHCRGSDGIVSMDRLGEEFAQIAEVMAESEETKN